MNQPQRLKSLSKVSRDLLRQGESGVADFKRGPDGVSMDDLVAFANAPSGGDILVGVDEIADPSGIQRGSIRGCDVSDSAILQIVNKAVACVPPVGLEVHIENLSHSPILRLRISSSATKPHCTPKGVYCVRDGSRNRPLHPTELLAIFLESEARTFSDRFESAADRLAKHMEEIEQSLSDSIDNMGSQLGWAESKLGDSETYLGTILALSKQIDSQTNDTAARFRDMFRQDNRVDSVRKKAEDEFRSEAIKQLLANGKLLEAALSGSPLTFTLQGKAAVELTKEEALKVFEEATQIAKMQRDEAKDQ